MGSHMKSSLIVEVGLETRLYQQEAVPDIPAATDGHSGLEVFVIFTDHAGTLAALRMADQLAESSMHASGSSCRMRCRMHYP